MLLVDEDADNGQRCEAILAKLRFAVAPAHTLAEATRVMDALRPNLIVGHVSDPEALRRAAPADIPVVILDEALERARRDDWRDSPRVAQAGDRVDSSCVLYPSAMA